MVHLNVPFLQQSFEFDCWYASLRMLVKFRCGGNAEPLGYEPAETAGMMRQTLRDDIRRQAVSQGFHPAAYPVRKALSNHPPRGLNAVEFVSFAQRNGLVAPMLPPPFVPALGTGGWTVDRLETLLRIHGPFWCAFGYGHIVVLKGVDMHGNLLIHDPQAAAGDSPYTIQQFNTLLCWNEAKCMMFLPPVPNVAAFLHH